MTPTEYVREWIEDRERRASHHADGSNTATDYLAQDLKQALAVVRERFEEINEMLNLSGDYPSPHDLMADLARTLGWSDKEGT